jgi:hypothetical protein
MHAGGFEHEHQAPDTPCKFNKKAILARTGWSDQQYETNLQPLDKDSHAYKWTTYDNKSVMKYYFKPDELEDGEQSSCYSGENLKPSVRDIRGLQDAYTAPNVRGDRERALIGGISSSSAPQPIRDLARALRQLDEGN